MPEVKNKYSRFLNNSFLTTYIVLFGYTAITLIEALRTTSVNTRHIMNIETAVSLVAGLVYGIFLEQSKQPDFDLKEIVPIRYLDWMITTPLILLALIVFYNNPSTHIDIKTYSVVIGLNWLMLLSGYLGEIKQIPRSYGLMGGFLFFFALLVYMFNTIVPKGSSWTVFFIFAAIWSGYGVAYMMDEEVKNISYNVLDVMSKAVFGVVLWLYFGKVLAFD
jgi:bacteriorhodopsin